MAKKSNDNLSLDDLYAEEAQTAENQFVSEMQNVGKKHEAAKATDDTATAIRQETAELINAKLATTHYTDRLVCEVVVKSEDEAMIKIYPTGEEKFAAENVMETLKKVRFEKRRLYHQAFDLEELWGKEGDLD